MYFAWLRGHHGRFEYMDECKGFPTGAIKPFGPLFTSVLVSLDFQSFHEEYLRGNPNVCVCVCVCVCVRVRTEGYTCTKEELI